MLGWKSSISVCTLVENSRVTEKERSRTADSAKGDSTLAPPPLQEESAACTVCFSLSVVIVDIHSCTFNFLVACLICGGKMRTSAISSGYVDRIENPFCLFVKDNFSVQRKFHFSAKRVFRCKDEDCVLGPFGETSSLSMANGGMVHSECLDSHKTRRVYCYCGRGMSREQLNVIVEIGDYI